MQALGGSWFLNLDDYIKLPTVQVGTKVDEQLESTLNNVQNTIGTAKNMLLVAGIIGAFITVGVATKKLRG